MKIKTSELIDAALDWAVAKCEGVNAEAFRLYYEPTEPTDYDNHGYPEFHYSSVWAQGGPIIEREWIELQNGSNLHPNLWGACKWSESDAGIPMWEGVGPTPLVAAMRCIVASKLGDTVDIPEELT